MIKIIENAKISLCVTVMFCNIKQRGNMNKNEKLDKQNFKILFREKLAEVVRNNSQQNERNKSQKTRQSMKL